MFNKLDNKTICLIIVMIFHTIFVCNSVNHSFCNDRNQISNIYSVGTHVLITQGMTTIWMFDTKTAQFSPDKQTLNSIFGEDHFDVVDSVFSFDLNACRGRPKICNNIEMARNLVVVIGEKIHSADISKPYGYLSYRLRPDDTLEVMSKNWAHNWGLTADDTFSGSFWPSFRRNGSLIIGGAYSKNESTLYLLVNEIDNNNNPLYRIYNRELNSSGVWGEWTAFASVKQNGMFAIRGSVYVVDSDNNIISYRTKSNGLIDKKKISSAKEFFNCFRNSTLLKDLTEKRANDFSEYRLSPDLEPFYNETNGTVPINETIETNDTTTTSTTTTTTTTELSTVITTEDTESPALDLTTISPPESSGQPISGWLVFFLILLIIGLIFVIVLIAILLNIKNKNNDKKANPPKPLPIAPTPAKGGTSPQSPQTSPNATGSSKTGSPTDAKPGGNEANLKANSVRSSMA